MVLRDILWGQYHTLDMKLDIRAAPPSHWYIHYMQDKLH